jgi:hypothetical protein
MRKFFFKMSPSLVLSITSSLLLVSATSLAKPLATARVVYDQNGLPRCFENPLHAGRGTLLIWKAKEKYQRVINAIALEQIDTASYTSEGRSCDDWQGLLFDAIRGNPRAVVAASANVVNSLRLPPKAVLGLQEISGGANEFHAEQSGADYLSHHPIGKFTVETNRALTARFGVGFAASIYKSWVLSQSRNSWFSKEVYSDLPEIKVSKGSTLGSQFKKRVVMLVKGLGNDQISTKRYDFLPAMLGGFGVPLQTIATTGYGRVSENAARVTQKLDETLSRGADVILISLSKGTLESTLAVSELNAKLEGNKRPAGYGHLRAFISLSGVYGSSFLVDFATEPVLSLLTDYFVSSDYEDHGQKAPAILPGLRDISDQFVPAIQARISSNGLPQKTNYVSVVSIIPKDGLSPDEGIGPLQNNIVRPFLSDAGANDGYIEYPQTQIPSAWASKTYVLPVDASHVFIDGEFMGERFANSEERQSVIGSILHVVGNILDQEDGQESSPN